MEFLETIEPWIYAGGLAAVVIFIYKSIKEDYFRRPK